MSKLALRSRGHIINLLHSFVGLQVPEEKKKPSSRCECLLWILSELRALLATLSCFLMDLAKFTLKQPQQTLHKIKFSKHIG